MAERREGGGELCASARCARARVPRHTSAEDMKMMLGAAKREGVSGFIQETMCPVIMVCASEGSVEMCSKRGVATAELFKPFARLNDINGTV